jgi:hypothetical protein
MWYKLKQSRPYSGPGTSPDNLLCITDGNDKCLDDLWYNFVQNATLGEIESHGHSQSQEYQTKGVNGSLMEVRTRQLLFNGHQKFSDSETAGAKFDFIMMADV